MGSKAHTWFKKLVLKQKQHAMKAALGNERGVATLCQRARPITARSLDIKGDIKDKPQPKAPAAPKKKLELPHVEGWKPRAFGSRKLARLLAR